MGRSIIEKVWDDHAIGDDLLFIDLHLVHEVTSPQAFDGLRLAGRAVRRPDRTLATADHNVPTIDVDRIDDPLSKGQLDALARNVAEFGIRYYGLGHRRQGIVHVIGPELGVTQPGMTIVCGDSHTATHGAFGALAFGIGTSEVEHVLATQTLAQKRSKTMRVRFEGATPTGVGAKDLILGLIGQVSASGMAGYVVEYTGQAITDLSMEGRMTVCNMSIEGGARRADLPGRDDVCLPRGPVPACRPTSTRPARAGLRYASDPDATYDREVVVDVSAARAAGDVGHEPRAGRAGHGPRARGDERRREERALRYMDLRGGQAISDIAIDRVFLGSCTNARIEDLRAAAAVVDGRRVAASVSAMVVPGSFAVKQQAEAEGLDRIFTAAGFEWRGAGCSMCLGMNPDILSPGERCASTSNRNFEGRQGNGGRTHLMSPEMAAAAAIAGHIVDVRDWE